jgi:hypothetical protein
VGSIERRLQNLEERQAELRARRAWRDEGQEAFEATMAKIRESPSGLDALQAYCATMEAAGGSVKDALLSEAGRKAIGRFGGLYIRSGAHVNDERKRHEQRSRR